MRYLSLFSGIEAASCAWLPLGWEAVAFSEIDPFCCELLRQRYPGVPNLGDITKIDWSRFNEQYGRIDIVVGGSPCQSFSVAGGRAGLAGESGLMFEYIRAVREVRPRWFVWENVPGALSSEDGAAFNQLLCEMALCGYGLAWRVLDSQFFDVAQRRERVFLVGSLGDMRCAEVLFDEESLRRDFKTGRKKREELTAALEAGDRGIHAHTLKLRHTGSPNIGRGSGPLVQTECSATLGTGNDQTLVHEPVGFKYHQGAGSRSLGDDAGVSPTITADYHQPAVCLQTDHLSQNGANASEEVCKTLDTQTPPAVVIPFAQNTRDELRIVGDGTVSGALSAQPGMKQQTFVCMADTQPNTMVDGEVCGTVTRRPYKDPPVVCGETTGPLCARDYKGVGNEYVQEGKVVGAWEP